MVVRKNLASILSKTLPETDHRVIGLRQKLFFFNDLSQGSCFFQPRGARIYNKLVDFLRQEYKKRHYDEVITPNIYNCRLWETSGHWDHYEKNMIKLNMAEREYSLKPMNCPGHCLMFKHGNIRASDQLPVRWADFGVLHRNELSGSLIGLTRVRRFQQDDAHIFCTPNQIESEVEDCLQFASQVYSKFGFTFDLKLSLRPEKYLGEPTLWDKAENSLRLALKKSNLSWTENEFEGAFYGPKIDFVVKDSHGRSHQCATIQLDFQLPERFELEYKDKERSDETNETTLRRPVIIHRAILGSLERFIAMITENCQGRWPFWISPLQAQVIPVHSNLDTYAKAVSDQLRELGFWVDCDLSNSTLNSKVRDAILMPYNLVFVVGQKEMESQSVTCRLKVGKGITHEDIGDMGSGKNINIPMEKLIDHLRELEERQVSQANLGLIRLLRRRFPST